MRSAAVLLVLLMFWGVGLLAFANRIAQSTPAADPPVSDGVVAFTGPSDARITAAMKLLETGKAKRMLISGVSLQASRVDIRGVAKATRRFYDCCVDLGRQATNTVGNGRETAAWARAEGYRTLIVVTADYHMPRAMLELRSALPEAKLTPYPIQTSELDARHWWRNPDDARRMIVEYAKYLVVLARETVLGLGPKAHRAATVSAANVFTYPPKTIAVADLQLLPRWGSCRQSRLRGPFDWDRCGGEAPSTTLRAVPLPQRGRSFSASGAGARA